MSRAMKMPPFVNLDTSKHDMSNNELDDKTFTKVDNFDFIDYNNEDVVNELYLGDRYSENVGINKLAYLDAVSKDKIIRKDLFATQRDYRDISLYSNDETNEGIKIKMQKEFLLGDNPRIHISKAISKILNNVNKEFVLDEATKKKFTEAQFEDERKELIFQLQKKQDSSNLKLIKAFSTCDTLLQILAQANRHIKESNTFKTTTETIMDNKIHDIFKREVGESEEINFKLKQDIYNVVSQFDFDNLDTLSEEDKLAQREELHHRVSNLIGKTIRKDIDFITNNTEEKISQAMKEEDDRIAYAVNGLINGLGEIKQLNTNINKYSHFTSKLNSKIKMTHNFTSLYQDFNDCYGIHKKLENLEKSISAVNEKNKDKIEKLKDKYLVNNDKDLISKLELEKELLLRNGNAKLSGIKNIFTHENINNIKFIQDVNVKKALQSFINEKDFDFNKTVSKWSSINLGSHYLSGIVNSNMKDIFESDSDIYSYSSQEKADITKIVSKNISKMIEDNIKELKKEDGSFTSSVANSIYNNFQKNNHEDIINNFILKPNDNDSSIIKDFKEELEKSPKPKLKSTIDKSLQDNIVDVMNFNNLTENMQIKSTIGDNDEIEKIANQTISNNGLRDFAKDIHDNDMNIDNGRNSEIKKDLPLDEHIRNLATKKYDNLANSLLSNTFNKLVLSHQAHNDFSLCVTGASIKKTSMETKLSTLDGCVQKYTQKIEQDSKELLSKVIQSQQGIGALNPFAGLMEIVALYGQIEAKKVKKRTEQIIREINKVAIEIGSATSDLERRARVYMVHGQDNANIYMTAVHDKEKHGLSSEFKQEYMASAIADTVEYESLNKYNFDYESFDKDTNELIDNNIRMGNIVLNGLKGMSSVEIKKALEDSKDILADNGIDIDKVNSHEDLKGLDDYTLSNISQKSNIDIKIEALSGNLKLKDKTRKVIYKSDITSEQVRRLDAIQKKIVEFELKGEGVSLQELIKDIKNNPDKAIFNKFNNSNSYTDDEISKHLLKEWLDENQIGYDDFENTIQKDYLDIENNKNKLILKAVIENLEEQKQFLHNQETTLIEKKQEFALLHNKFKHLDSYSKELSEDKEYLKYQKLQNEISELESSFSIHIRPEERIQKTIDEVKTIFSADKSSLEKRNILGNAINILSRSGHSVENIQLLKNCLSADTDYFKDVASGDKSIIGFAMGKKGYKLKINKEAKESQVRYQNESLKRYFEKLDYRSDRELLEGTDEQNSITSLETWSNTIKSSNDVLHNNQSISSANRDMETIRETIQKSNNLYKNGYNESAITDIVSSYMRD